MQKNSWVYFFVFICTLSLTAPVHSKTSQHKDTPQIEYVVFDELVILSYLNAPVETVVFEETWIWSSVGVAQVQNVQESHMRIYQHWLLVMTSADRLISIPKNLIIKAEWSLTFSQKVYDYDPVLM